VQVLSNNLSIQKFIFVSILLIKSNIYNLKKKNKQINDYTVVLMKGRNHRLSIDNSNSCSCERSIGCFWPSEM